MNRIFSEEDIIQNDRLPTRRCLSPKVSSSPVYHLSYLLPQAPRVSPSLGYLTISLGHLPLHSISFPRVSVPPWYFPPEGISFLRVSPSHYSNGISYPEDLLPQGIPLSCYLPPRGQGHVSRSLWYIQHLSPEHLLFMGTSLIWYLPPQGIFPYQAISFPGYLPPHDIFFPRVSSSPRYFCLTTVSPFPGFLSYLRYLPPISISLPSTNCRQSKITII